ncbi:MAG: polyketide cyclase [Burkholderiales bacterium PBB4]|nr:MAG: polyketide cyclase [Burkholderiales bacterium PBB4]
MVKKILLGLGAALVLLLVFAATRPDTFRVERRIQVQAPAAKIFPLLNDFHHFASWSPWQKLDPAMQVTHSGEASGPGAVYAWKGNSDVGSGRMEVLEPFEGHNTTEYSLKTEGSTTTVTWAMFGPSPFVSKLMGVFVSMDSMIGKDFELGLANLKAVAEKP